MYHHNPESHQPSENPPYSYSIGDSSAGLVSSSLPYAYGGSPQHGYNVRTTYSPESTYADNFDQYRYQQSIRTTDSLSRPEHPPRAHTLPIPTRSSLQEQHYWHNHQYSTADGGIVPYGMSVPELSSSTIPFPYEARLPTPSGMSAPPSEYDYSEGYESGGPSGFSRDGSYSPKDGPPSYGPGAPSNAAQNPQQYIMQHLPNNLSRSPQFGGRKRAATQGRVTKQSPGPSSLSAGAVKSASDAEVETIKKPRTRKPFEPERRLEVRKMRQTGACFRCRWLKKPCGIGTPCPQCVNVRGRIWTYPCMRVNITDLSGLSDIGLQSKQRSFLNTNILGWSGSDNTIGVTHGFHNSNPQAGILPLQVIVEEVVPFDSRALTMRWSSRSPEELSCGLYWRWYDESNPSSIYNTATSSYAIRKFQLTEYQLDTYLDCDRSIQATGGYSDLFQGYRLTKSMMAAAWDYSELSRDPMLKKAIRVYHAVSLQNYLLQSEPSSSALGINIPSSRAIAPAFVQVQLELLIDGRRAELEKEILVELQRAVFSRKKKYWLTIFFTIYVLLAILERTLWNYLAWKSKGWASPDFSEDRVHEIGNILVAVFRAINQGSRPLSRAIDAEEVMKDVGDEYGTGVVALFNSVRALISSEMTMLQSRKDAVFNIHDRFSLEAKFTCGLLLA